MVSPKSAKPNSHIEVWTVKDSYRNTYFRFTPCLDQGWVRNPDRARLFETAENALRIASRHGNYCDILPIRVGCRRLARQWAQEWLFLWLSRKNDFTHRLEKIVADLKSVSRVPEKVTDEAILTDCVNFGLELCIAAEDPAITIPNIWKHEDAWSLLLSAGLDQFEKETKVLLANKTASLFISSGVPGSATIN